MIKEVVNKVIDDLKPDEYFMKDILRTYGDLKEENFKNHSYKILKIICNYLMPIVIGEWLIETGKMDETVEKGNEFFNEIMREGIKDALENLKDILGVSEKFVGEKKQ